MKQERKKRYRYQRRKRRVRKRVNGTPDRPRLSVSRSNRQMYAQIIDDTCGRTIVAASTMDKDLRGKLPGGGGNTAAAEVVGAELASRAQKAGVEKVVFDRNGLPYHGRVRALAESARKGGLKF